MPSVPSHIASFILTFMLFIPFVQMIGLMVPLYMDPNEDWDNLVNIKNAYPSLPIVAIINPDSGPGTFQNSDYVSGIDKMLGVGIIVVGYDHTTSATRPVEDVTADMDAYQSYYPKIQGIFFDEMEYLTTGGEEYYKTAGDYAKSKGFNMTIGNPGSKIPLSYMPTLDYIVIFENGILANLTDYSEYSSYMSHLVMMVHTQPTLPTEWIGQAADMIQWIYVTNYTTPNPYDTLPSYLSNLAGLLNTANTNKNNKPVDNGMSLTTKIVIGLIVGIITIAIVGFVIRYLLKRRGDAGGIRTSLDPSGTGNRFSEKDQGQGLHLSSLSSKD